ncbi:MAG: DUF2807 domain-containing protein [Bacteroidales bacterium]|nr:DUF2807 domain-containing protein [Bacteroidales bacterium]
MEKKFNNIIILIITIIFTGFTSCISSQSPLLVKGTGEVKDKSYDVSGFDAIEVSGGFDVDLIQGNSEGVVLSAQENLFEHITVKVEAGTLKIYTERNIIQTKGMKAKISLKSIQKLRVSGGGDVIASQGLDVPNLNLEISGGGDLKTNLKTNNMECRISGGGDVEINGSMKDYNMNITGGGDLNSNVVTEKINCSMTGGGDISLKSTGRTTGADISISGGGDLTLDIDAGRINCTVSGGGDATLAGKADMFEISVNGGGDVHAGNLVTKTTNFKASGGSDVRVNASSDITGYISGGGQVYYSGNPASVNIDAKGGSEVHKE